jgi:chromate transport protein ChrA
MIEFSTVFRIALTFIVIAILTCRLGKMSKRTKIEIRQQHAILLGCMWCSLAMPNEWAITAIVFGLIVFFGYSTNRWKVSDPSIKSVGSPVHIEPIHWPLISGGTNDKH